MKTAIVILNWNGRDLLERFLPSVVENSRHIAEIYVADNASTDDSVSFVKDQYPQVTLIVNEANGGYARGYNDALKHIEADLYVLLNSDVQVSSGWLEPMVNLFENTENLGAAQPKIKDLNNPEYFEYAGAAGGFLDFMGYPYCRGRVFDTCEKDRGQYDDTIEVQWASGACLFIRAEAFWTSGGLDETYFAHQEEIDLCWRLKNNGWILVASGASEVLHLGGATLASSNPIKTFYNFRNSLFCIVKNVGGFNAFLAIICRLLLDGVAAIKFLLEGKPKHLLAILKSHGSFYYHLPYLLAKRKRLTQSASYHNLTSIVWAYYVKKQRTFDILNSKP